MQKRNNPKYDNIFEILKSLSNTRTQAVMKSPRVDLLKPLLFPRYKHFMPIKHEDGKTRLYQYNQTGFLFRGQHTWYKKIKPSLYRENVHSFNKFIYRLMLCELEIILEEHPVVQDFIKMNFHVSVSGIAQHYGIPTEWIDFTADPLIAVFFAICEKIDGKYVIKKEGTGVMYKTPLLLYNQDNEEDCDIIGLQPCSRPCVQQAYTIKYSKDVLLKWHEMRFMHDKECSQKIFDYFKGGKVLFPKDFLSQKVKNIKDSKKFSKHAVNLTIQKYPFYDKSIFERYLINNNIQIVKESIHRFKQNEITRIQSEYFKGKKSMLNLIEEPMYFRIEEK